MLKQLGIIVNQMNAFEQCAWVLEFRACGGDLTHPLRIPAYRMPDLSNSTTIRFHLKSIKMELK
jgi:hypothetical protein